VNPAGTRLRRVLLYAHDTYGLGHLRRNLAIAGRLLQHRPGLQVVLMTGSSVAERFPMPRGLALVRLPPVVKVVAEDYRPRDQRLGIDLVRRARSAIMADTARRFRPDVFLVDHAPQGMKGELLPVFATLRSASPATRIVLGLRDVLDDPDSVRQTWSEQGAYQTLETVYDRILVYGSPGLFDVAPAYGLSAAVAAKLTYCGYVCRPAEHRTPGPSESEAFVLGTAGGGGDGAEVLLVGRRSTAWYSGSNVAPPVLLPATRRARGDALLDELDLTGSKKGCDHGQCGACTVLIDGRRANACLLLAVTLDGAEVTTIEGHADNGELHSLLRAFDEHDAF